MLVSVLLLGAVAAARAQADVTPSATTTEILQENDPLEPATLEETLQQRRCVPTAVSRGPCHACVCTARGAYRCRPSACDYSARDATVQPIQPECEPDMLYNEGALWCHCDQLGFWQTASCRGNFHYMRARAVALHPAAPHSVQCEDGTLYVADCNVCECRGGALSPGACTTRSCARGNKTDACVRGQLLRAGRQLCACSEIGYYVDNLCITLASDSDTQKITSKDVAVLIAETALRGGQSVECQPHSVVYRDCNRCKCSENGKLMCTSKLCFSHMPHNLTTMIDKSLRRHTSLPELESDREPCEPGRRYRYRCNTCYCTSKGLPACTTMLCLDHPPAPAHHSHNHKGKGLSTNFQHRFPAINEGDNCTQGQTYRLDCNLCRCGSANRLICSKKLCLSASDMAEQLAFEHKMKNKLKNTSPSKTKEVYMELFDDKVVIHQRTDVGKPAAQHGGAYLRSENAPDKQRDIYNVSNKKNEQETVHGKDNNIARLKTKENKYKDEKKMTTRSKSAYPELPKSKCKPGQVYSKSCQRCFCNHKKIARCTNRPCKELQGPVRVPDDVYPRMTTKDTQKLQSLPHEAARCTPGRAYTVACNVCLCLANGNLLCNTLLCLAVEEVNRLAALKQSRKHCKSANDTYPHQECIRCTCVQDQFQCTPLSQPCTPSRFRRALHGDFDAGKPKLHLGEHDKCISGMVYRQSCNNCYCQEDGSLRCTRKGCLNYQQVKKLKQQRERLLKIGL